MTRSDRIRAFLGDELGVRVPQPPLPPSQGVPVSGKVFDLDELVLGIEALLDGWWTSGPYAKALSHGLQQFVGARHCILTNSGSSANLLALSALTSARLGEDRLRPGDEVIIAATSFPTTLNPILQNGLVPVLVDITLGDYNIAVAEIEAAISSRTRAIMTAHTLGNPFDLDAVLDIAHQHRLWLIEDACDAMGAEWRGQRVGSFGDLATASFYPAHQMTTAEGGAVYTQQSRLKTLVESFRDWGRDCWCETGIDDTCGKRFQWSWGSLPDGYDHKYTYSHIGYNLKMTDIQAAIGIAQLRKLPAFVEQRRRNFQILDQRLRDMPDQLLLPIAHRLASPSWFGYPITLRPDATLTRSEVIAQLEAAGIKTRLLFAGNIARQPAYQQSRMRLAGSLPNADWVTRATFWVGLYPALGEDSMHYIADTLHQVLHHKEAIR